MIRFKTLREMLDFVQAHGGPGDDPRNLEANARTVLKNKGDFPWGFSVSESQRLRDGSAIVLVMEHGFPGSEITAPDGDEVRWYGFEKGEL